MTESFFTSKDAWNGGFYELAFEVATSSDERLQAALATLWRHSDLDGCYLEREREPWRQPRIIEPSLDSGNHLLGVASLPNRAKATCGTCLIRHLEGADWLVFYLPMGSLAKTYPVGGFPFGPQEVLSWQDELDDWLAGIGLWVANAVSYDLGVIGFEVAAETSSVQIAREGIPQERGMGLLWPTDGEVIYHRRNRE